NVTASGTANVSVRVTVRVIGAPNWRVTALQTEVLPEVDLPDGFIINNLAWSARSEHASLADDVCTVAYTQRFAHIVVGDEHADAAFLEKADDLLDVEYSYG